MNASATFEDGAFPHHFSQNSTLFPSKASGSERPGTAGDNVQHVLYKFLLLCASGLLF